MLVVKDINAFEAFYGGGLPIAGTFDGSLANEGESITLRDADQRRDPSLRIPGRLVPLTDGDGFSLTVVDPAQEITHWNAKAGWRPSEHAGGSPGADDQGIAPGSIVIHEVSNDSTHPAGNWIELRNLVRRRRWM